MEGGLKESPATTPKRVSSTVCRPTRGKRNPNSGAAVVPGFGDTGSATAPPQPIRVTAHCQTPTSELAYPGNRTPTRSGDDQTGVFHAERVLRRQRLQTESGGSGRLAVRPSDRLTPRRASRNPCVRNLRRSKCPPPNRVSADAGGNEIPVRSWVSFRNGPTGACQFA